MGQEVVQEQTEDEIICDECGGTEGVRMFLCRYDMGDGVYEERDEHYCKVCWP